MNLQPNPAPAGQPVTKLSLVRAAMAAGDFRRAIAIAARFPDLGNERDAILDAHTAFTNPRFVRQVGKDPATLIEAGRAAMVARYIPRAQCQGGAL